MEPGYRFTPADHDLTDGYLAGEMFSSFICHADVYSAVPDVLVSGRQLVRDRDNNDACYIISPVRFAGTKKKKQKLRRIDGDPRKSYWHSEKGKIPLKDSETGGYVQDFVHVIKATDGRIERLGWRMKEYGRSTEEHGDSDLVLCKLYRTPRKKTSSPVPVSEDPNVSKKRKAADGDHHEYYMRLMEDHPLMADPTLTPVQEIDVSWHQEQAAQTGTERDGAAPPSSFIQSIEQEFTFLYPNHKNEVMTEEAAPPWPPAAQWEEEDATGLMEAITADDQMDAILGEEGAQPEPEWAMEHEFPLYPSDKNDAATEEAAPPSPVAAKPEEDPATGLVETITAHNQMVDAISLEEEGAHPEPEPEPDEPAPDEVIYGLPCPAFSPEMIWRCSDDVLTPWPSPSSMSMIFDLY